MSTSRLLHVGGVVVDLVYRIDDLPMPGGERVAQDFVACAGGAFHTLAAAAAQGMQAVSAGGHGTGPFGDLVRSALAAQNIPTLLPRSSEQDTGTCVVLVTVDGERTFVGYPGAESVLRPDDLLSVQPTSGDVVVLSGYTAAHPGCHDALVSWLPTLDTRTTLLFDPSPLVASIPSDLLAMILARAQWTSANAREAAAITGHDQLDGQGSRLLDRHGPPARGVLVRTGADGCHLQARGEAAKHLPAHAARALDTSGAGDVHVGTFLARLSAGDTPEEAARTANAVAAVAVTRPSGAPAPTREDVSELLTDRVQNTLPHSHG